MVGDNVYGPAKLAAIEAWLAREGIDREDCHIRFYSDHVSDAPVLGWADEPFAVNAHGPLRTLARKRGWPIVDWERWGARLIADRKSGGSGKSVAVRVKLG